MYVCMCTGVTSKQIQTLLKDGEAQTFEDIEFQTGAGTGCGCCKNTVEQMVNEFHLENKGLSQAQAPHELVSLQVVSPQPITPLLLRQSKDSAPVVPSKSLPTP